MKKALLVAVSDSPATPALSIPSATVSVRALAAALCASQGFAATDIRILRTAAETAAGSIQAEITGWLAKGAVAGDVLLFGVNGHGGIGTNGTYFIPGDGSRGWVVSEADVIDWLGVAAQAASVYALYDCCRLPDAAWHTRFARLYSQRWLISARARSALIAPPPVAPSSLVTLYGCAPGESCGYDNRYGCSFTGNLSSALSSPSGPPTIAGVITQTAAALRLAYYRQSPQFTPPAAGTRTIFT